MSENKIKFIIGGHGSGKSDWIDNRFISMSKDDKGKIDLDKKLYIIVPEQDTNDRQRTVLKKNLNSFGILNIDIVSFDRIAHTVFEELAIEPDKENVVEDDVKTMILTLILSRLKLENRIEYYKKMVGKIGFSKKLTQTMSEFYSYNVTDEQLLKVINSTDKSMLKSKISDLKEIYSEFKKELEAKGFFIKEDKYNLLDKYIDRSHFFNDAIVAFDGFTGFTPVQLSIFSKIVKVSKEIYVTVDLRDDNYKLVDNIIDKANSLIETKNYYNELNNVAELRKLYDKANVFSLSLSYIVDIIASQMIYGSKLTKENVLYFKQNYKYDRKGKEDLSFLEKNIYNYKHKSFNVKPSNISLFVSRNVTEEVENLAQNILKNVRSDVCTYNDIRVIVPNIEEYADRIKRIFKYYNIPLFIDDSKSILNSPYIESIRAAIDVVDYSFTYDSVIRFLHSGIEKQVNELYELENFIRKYGIIGYNRYKDGFEKIKTCAESVLESKKTYLNALIDFYENCKKKKTISNYIEAVYKFIEEYRLNIKFDDFIDTLKNDSIYLSNEKQELTILDFSKEVVENTLKNIEAINKNVIDSEMSIGEFKRLFDIGISEKSVKTIPSSLDQVVVGDLMRSRFDNPKILYFLGLNQSKVPAKSSDLTIIDDKMRNVFESNGIRLSQTIEETALNQRFYIYLALTNPTEKLVLSYPRLNFEGESDSKSSVIVEIEKLFSDVSKEPSEIESYLYENKVEKNNYEFYNKNLLIDYITDNFYNLKLSSVNDKSDEYIMAKNKSVEKALAYLKERDKIIENYTDGDIDYDILTSKILNSHYNIDDSNIKNELVNKLINNDDGAFVSSATSIENFNKCNFRYFFEKTLKLKANDTFKISSNEVGSYIHSVFEYLFKDNHFDFRNESDKYVDEMITKALSYADSVVENEKFHVFGISDIGVYYGASKLNYVKERARDIVKVSINVFRDFADGTKFNNTETESKMFFEYKADDKESFALTGKIDRIDTYETDDNIYVRITDYKSTEKMKKFKIEEVRDGVSIQLVVYLDYIVKSKYDSKKKVKACGSYYFWTSDPLIEINYNDLEDLASIKNDKEIGFNGITNIDEESISVSSNSLEYKDKEKKDTLFTKNGHAIYGDYLDDNEIDDLIKNVEDKVSSSINDIKNGRIKIDPYDENECRYCDYINICKHYRMAKKQDD